jgi:hypothetical protein
MYGLQTQTSGTATAKLNYFGQSNTLTVTPATARMRILAVAVLSTAGATVVIMDGVGYTPLVATFDVPANGGFVLPLCDVGWWETGDNNLVVTATNDTNFNIVYQVIK